METKITKLFKIQYPVICSGMTGISRPKLVAAVSNAGGLGILASADLKPRDLRDAIKEIRDLTDKPFAANVPFIIPGIEEKLEVIIDEKVDIVNYTLGTGEKLIKAVHEYGGKAVATVTNHKHALSAQKRGADALIVTGNEAAAHGGDVTSLVLIPSIAEAVSIPVIGAGGFADGRGLVAALALGAEGVAMGTRFMNTVESPAHEKMKEMSIEKQAYDTIYSEKIDGIPCRAIRSKATDKLIKDKLYLVRALYSSQDAAEMFGFPWFKLFMGILMSGYEKSRQLAKMANGFRAMRIGMEDGDKKRGVFLMGQVTGLISDTPTVAEVMESILAEAGELKDSLAMKI